MRLLPNTEPPDSVVAINDGQSSYPYPERVRFEISEGDLASYRAAAGFLNAEDVDLVCLQHEYGIFGGKSGNYIIELLSVRCRSSQLCTRYFANRSGPTGCDAQDCRTLRAPYRHEPTFLAYPAGGLSGAGRRIDLIPHGPRPAI